MKLNLLKHFTYIILSSLILLSCKTYHSAYTLSSHENDGYTYRTILLLEQDTYKTITVINPLFSDEITKIETINNGVLQSKADTIFLLNNEEIETYYYSDITCNYLYKYTEITDAAGKRTGLIKGSQMRKIDKRQMKIILEALRMKKQNGL